MIKENVQDTLFLGNLVKRDWGYAPEYCDVWRILQYDKPEDFVLATGKQFSVRDFVESTFKELGIIIKWKGEKEHEVGINDNNGKTIIKIDPRYYRPTEVETLLGDSKKAKEKLGWESKTTFHELVKKMAHADWELVKRSLK